MSRAIWWILLCFQADAAVSFKSQVAPILLEKCVTCHGPEKSKGAFRLDSFANLQKPGESKTPPITPGSPEKSHLFQLITTNDADDRMPQKSDRLADAQVELIRGWINEGAQFDGDSPSQSLASLVPFQPGPEPLAHYPFPQPILALAWSPDGKSIASSGYHEALVWSDEGKLQKRISRLPERIHGLAFLGADRVAVAAGTPGKSGEALICRIDSTEPPQLLARFSDVATCLAISSDRARFAVGAADASIHVFESSTGKEVFVIQQHADWITALAFSPDGTKLASASRDRTARIFDLKSGELLETYAEHEQPIYSIAFSSDGKRAFTGGKAKRIHAWRTQEAKKTAEFPPLAGDVLSLAVFGGRIFASGGDHQIHEFSAGDQKETRQLGGHTDWVYTLAIEPGTKRLASGSYNGEIRIWNAETGETIHAFQGNP